MKEKLSIVRNKQEKKKEVQGSEDTPAKISEEVAALRNEFLQIKQLMMSMRQP